MVGRGGGQLNLIFFYVQFLSSQGNCQLYALNLQQCKKKKKKSIMLDLVHVPNAHTKFTYDQVTT